MTSKHLLLSALVFGGLLGAGVTGQIHADTTSTSTVNSSGTEDTMGGATYESTTKLYYALDTPLAITNRGNDNKKYTKTTYARL